MRRDHGEIYPRFDEVYVSEFLKTMCIWQPLLSLRVSRTEQADQFEAQPCRSIYITRAVFIDHTPSDAAMPSLAPSKVAPSPPEQALAVVVHASRKPWMMLRAILHLMPRGRGASDIPAAGPPEGGEGVVHHSHHFHFHSHQQRSTRYLSHSFRAPPGSDKSFSKSSSTPASSMASISEDEAEEPPEPTAQGEFLEKYVVGGEPQEAKPKGLPKGWQGSERTLPIVDGVHDSRSGKAKRRQLRLLPEIQSLVGQLWAVAVKRGVRLALKDYMDYHLSSYCFVTAIEGGVDVCALSDDDLDYFDAYENAMQVHSTRS